jgi:serine protease Do
MQIRQRLNWMLTGALLMGVVLLVFGVVSLPGSTATIGAPAVVGAQGSVSLNSLETQFVDLYNQVNPAVVSIQVVERTANGGAAFSQGSGFFYDTAGHIITNYHVAGEATEMAVVMSDGTQREAALIGGDPDSDLAVIKIDPSGLNIQALPIGDSEALQVGQMVVAIGNPFGLSGTMTSGIVSALGRSLPSQEASLDGGGTFNTPDVIQTDTAINPGNSGGPLLNLAGEVVGVNTAIRSTSEVNSGIGFAVPANLVARIAPQLVQFGEYQHPWLGISGRTLDPTTASDIGLNSQQGGVFVATVTAASPAMSANLRSADVITSANGITITSFDDLVHYLSSETVVGQTITLNVLRNGQAVQVPVTLAPRP